MNKTLEEGFKMKKLTAILVLIIGLTLININLLWSDVTEQPSEVKAADTPVVLDAPKDISQTNQSAVSPSPQPTDQTIATQNISASTVVIPEDSVKYTLGPDDVIEIEVRRHPEFSATYSINSEGKIQYKFVGDIQVSGLTKNEVKEKLREILKHFIAEPDINVAILEYRSKVIYVVGEVGAPGKYFMRSDTIPVREAVVQAGLPTVSSSMRRTQLITPDVKGRPKSKYIDLYKLLYEGNLKLNVDMKPGDVLYVPSTFFAKVFRIISPVAAPVGTAASTATSVTGVP
jgi:polysaccharide export outer membrane protein